MQTRINFRLSEILALFKGNLSESLESEQEDNPKIMNEQIKSYPPKFKTFFESQQSILKNYKRPKDLEDNSFPVKGILKKSLTYDSDNEYKCQNNDAVKDRCKSFSVRFQHDVVYFEKKKKKKRSATQLKQMQSRLVIIKPEVPVWSQPQIFILQGNESHNYFKLVKS